MEGEKRIGQYRLLQKIGQGGMGQVFLAYDSVLERKVAIKFLTDVPRTNPIARLAFLREAKAAARLDHPFICDVHEVGEDDGNAFIVMEYVEGQSLFQRLHQGTLPLSEALKVIQEVAEALEVAHRKGIVHRDLKPANIMLTPQGHAKVMDFGLAKWVGEEDDSDPIEAEGPLPSGDETTIGRLQGTPSYMSPEQASGEPVDFRSDFFSLGIVLQECVSGKHPFRKATIVETISSILRDAPVELSLKNESVPPALSQILQRTLAKGPEQRYQDAGLLVQNIKDLRAALIRKEQQFVTRAVTSVSLLVILALASVWYLSSSKEVAAEVPVKTLLVADSSNETQEEIFDGILEEGLSVGLESASFVRLLAREEALRAAADLKAGTTQLSPGIAQLVALRNGIDLVLASSIVPKDGRYDVTVEIHDPLKGEENFTVGASGVPRGGVLRAVGELSVEIRQRLGDLSDFTPEVIQRETFTAANLDAAHNYAQAQKILWAGNDQEALPYFERALELDPNLGRAYSGIAIIHRNAGEHDLALKFQEKALRLIDRMTERERLRTRGNYYVMKGDSKKAVIEFQELVNGYPGDLPGYNNLAVAYFYLRDMKAALEQTRRALELEPESMTLWYNFTVFNLYSGEFSTASETAQKLIKEGHAMPDLYVCLALAEAGLGDFTAAEKTYGLLQRVFSDSETIAAEGLADLAIARGMNSEAIRLLRESIASSIENGPSSALNRVRVLLASTLTAQGEEHEALGLVDAAVTQSSEERILYEAAMVYLALGKPSEASSMGKGLVDKLHDMPRFYGNLILGEIARVSGQARSALDYFQEACRVSDQWLCHWHLGRLYLDQEEYAHAHAEFEACFRRQGEAVAVFLDDLPTYRYLPAVHLYLGKAQEGLGSPAAQRSFETYRNLAGSAGP